ncbi:hypothetical protein MMC22_000584 [Lobaria immixta]|nr:hypothetical protein [Lobaria immixta]
MSSGKHLGTVTSQKAKLLEPVEVVCGLDYGKEKGEAAENNFTDPDHLNLGSLVGKLHILADQLTRASLSQARVLFVQQNPHLERDLERAKGSLDKPRKMMMSGEHRSKTKKKTGELSPSELGDSIAEDPNELSKLGGLIDGAQASGGQERMT